MEPGTKIAVISKSGEGVTHVAPSDEKPSEKAAPSPLPPAEEKEKPKPKVETTSMAEKAKESSLPPKSSATEPQLPPKEKERRVSLTFSSYFMLMPIIFFSIEYV